MTKNTKAGISSGESQNFIKEYLISTFPINTGIKMALEAKIQDRRQVINSPMHSTSLGDTGHTTWLILIQVRS